MRILVFSVAVAVLTLGALIFAQVRRSHDINEMRQLSIENCHKIEGLKVVILRTAEASTGLTEAEKVKARLGFAPKSC